jgi:zinc protease
MPTDIRFDKYTLSNGLDVILHEDHSVPIAAVNVWYHVGSQNEDPDRTGFAHLFEHIMFRGSQHHPSGFFGPLQELGANINGSTTVDRTNYYENVPAEYLELALWLESDRMGFLLEALDEDGFAVEREVVKNERRQSYENRPYGLASQEIRRALFPAHHPYHWQTIGSQEHLDAASIEDVKAFFRRFYLPNNASLAIAGDIDPEATKRLVERYFGDLPPGPPVARVERWVPRLDGEVRLTLEDRVQLPRLYFAWPGPPRFDPDEAPLDVLVSILAEGHSSRLYRSLVYERQIARTASAGYDAMQMAGEIRVDATVAPTSSVEEVERVLLAELERIQTDAGGPTPEEMQRALNRLEAAHVRQLESLGGFRGRANLLNYFNVFAGDPGRLNHDVERYRAVTAADVRRVARCYLGPDRVRLVVSPVGQLAPAPGEVDRSQQPGAGQPRPFRAPVPTRLRLSNGAELLVVEKRAVPTVATAAYFPGGVLLDPPAAAGLVSLTTRLVTEGTTTRSSAQIADESELLAAYLNVGAHREYSVGTVDVLTQHWPAALDLLVDVLANPAFPEREVDRIRRERLVDLRRLRDDPGAISDRVTTGVLYGRDTAYGHPASGEEASIERITRDTLRDQHARSIGHLRPTFVVVGDVDPDAAARQLETALAGWRLPDQPPPAPPAVDGPGPRPTTIYLVDKPGAAQSIIAAGQLSVPRLHPDYLPLVVVNMALGGQFTSRLNLNLRADKGYTYGYRSRFDWRLGPSSFVAGGAVQTAVTSAALSETIKELRDVHDERPLTGDEFEKARSSLMRGYPPSFETAGQVLGRVVDLVHFGLPDDYFAGQLERLAAVSLADARQAAERHIRPDELSIVVVGDRAAIEEGLQQLDLPVVPLDYDGRAAA